jgi:hypothetical protein
MGPEFRHRYTHFFLDRGYLNKMLIKKLFSIKTLSNFGDLTVVRIRIRTFENALQTISSRFATGNSAPVKVDPARSALSYTIEKGSFLDNGTGNSQVCVTSRYLYPVLWIRIRKDPKLFVGSGSGTQGFGSGSG